MLLPYAWSEKAMILHKKKFYKRNKFQFPWLATLLKFNIKKRFLLSCKKISIIISILFPFNHSKQSTPTLLPRLFMILQNQLHLHASRRLFVKFLFNSGFFFSFHSAFCFLICSFAKGTNKKNKKHWWPVFCFCPASQPLYWIEFFLSLSLSLVLFVFVNLIQNAKHYHINWCQASHTHTRHPWQFTKLFTFFLWITI